MTRTAIITGGNRGLGFEICRQLGNRGVKIILTSRSAQRGEQAMLELAANGVAAEVFVMDVRDPDRVEALADYLQSNHDGLDILVNNAAVAMSKLDQRDVAQETIDTNVFAPVAISDRLMPLMRERGRIVMVSSQQGKRSFLSSSLLTRFDAEQTVDGMLAMMREFVVDVLAGTYESKGWPASTYRVSKLVLNKITQILAKDLTASGNPKRILVNAVDPGWIQTEMGGPEAPRTPEEGAEAPVWLALLDDDGPQGGFYHDRTIVDW